MYARPPSLQGRVNVGSAGERFSAVEPGLHRVVVADPFLSVLPAQQSDVSLDLSGEVHEPKFHALQLPATLIDLTNAPLQFLGELLQMRVRLEHLSGVALMRHGIAGTGNLGDCPTQRTIRPLQAIHEKLEPWNELLHFRHRE
jgi:hypothetical protein